MGAAGGGFCRRMMKRQHIQPGAHRKVGDELDLLEPDAQMPRAWEAWEVYQFKADIRGHVFQNIRCGRPRSPQKTHLRRRIHCKLRYKLRGLSFWWERK